jgi:hypothetical protein
MSASIISAHLDDKIISVVTVTAPDRYAAVTVARAVVSDALNHQALSSSRSADDRAQHRAEPAARQETTKRLLAFRLVGAT